jgi:hypothetical protein
MASDLLEDDRNGAIPPDPDTEYRYRLWRTWDADLPTAVFVLLNPSTAPATEDDQTVTKCINYADRWGYGRLELVNLFALRATSPEELYDHPDPVGPRNDQVIQVVCSDRSLVVCGWGVHGELEGRGREVAMILEEHGIELFCLGTTKDGHPWHPGRKPGDLDPQPFSYEEAADG